MTTATQIAGRDGLGGLSMRRLADELGITAMSLDGYVPGKAGLLDVMADRAYAHDPARCFKFGLQRIIDGIRSLRALSGTCTVTNSASGGR